LTRWWCTLVLWAALAASAGGDPVTAPPEHRRTEDQTFLTYPEWFLVHSPAELAVYLAAGRSPSEFPWGGHVAQFWQGYRAVTRETASYPFNGGYHLMVSVIGGSTTVEYALRSAYESTLGRLSEASADGAHTAEDALAARVAQQYVDFIRVDPWYLFDFVTPLRELWSSTLWGQPHTPRKLERRYALTTEYAIKAGYAWLIKLATGAIYETARPVTAMVLSGAPQPSPAALPELRCLQACDSTPLVTVPRYRAFMFYAQALAAQQLDFIEIAGNRGTILVSVIQQSDAALPIDGTHVVLTQPILTQPGRERLLVALPVQQLAQQLRRWQAAGVEVEHIHDY
jgi:hypothetical protein